MSILEAIKRTWRWMVDPTYEGDRHTYFRNHAAYRSALEQYRRSYSLNSNRYSIAPEDITEAELHAFMVVRDNRILTAAHRARMVTFSWPNQYASARQTKSRKKLTKPVGKRKKAKK